MNLQGFSSPFLIHILTGKGGIWFYKYFYINGSPPSLSCNCLETLQTGVRSSSPISFLLTTHPSKLVQAHANRTAAELDLLVSYIYPAVLIISLFKIKHDEIKAVSTVNMAKLRMDFR